MRAAAFAQDCGALSAMPLGFGTSFRLHGSVATLSGKSDARRCSCVPVILAGLLVRAIDHK